MRFPALHVGFNGRVLEDVVDHEAFAGLHSEEFEGLVERHEEAVDALAFEELVGIGEGFKRRVPGRGEEVALRAENLGLVGV